MKYTLSILALFAFLFVHAQQNRSSQKITIPNTAYSRFSSPSGVSQISFFDGLGRLVQRVDESNSVTGKDFIRAYSYDEFGRQTQAYLPYTIAGNGLFRPEFKDECLQFYQNQSVELQTSYPFTTTLFENCPFAIPVKNSKAGESFQIGSGHETQFIERPNLAKDKILRFEFNYSSMKPVVRTDQGQLINQLNFDGMSLGAFAYPSNAKVNCITTPNTGLSPNSAANEPNAFVFNSGYGNNISFSLNQGTYVFSCMVKKWNGASTVIYFKNNTSGQIYNGQFALDNDWTEVKIPFTVTTNNNQLLVSCSGPTGKVLLDDIRIYNQQSAIVTPQYYTDGSCWIKSTIHANGQQEMKIFDASNQLILHRMYADTVVAKETYYVYNRHGLLAAIIQPEGVKALYNNNFEFNTKISNGSGSTNTLFDLFVQQNIYDERNRLISNKLPGTGTTNYVYDLMDRLVMSQDPQQALAFKWTFQKFDEQERPIIKGVFQTERNLSRADLQDRFNKALVYYEYADRTPLFYSNQVFPVSNIVDTLVLNYYDTYDANFDATNEWDVKKIPFNALDTKGTCFKGLTVTKAKLLGNSASGWITKINAFDYLNRNNVSFELLPLGGINTLEKTFNFNGSVAKEIKLQQLSASQTAYEWSTENEFDAMGRLNRTWLTNPDGIKVLMRELTYNELGQTEYKQLHALGLYQPFLQRIDYAYNLHGQLTQINNIHEFGSADLFAMEFCYDKQFSMVNSGGTFSNSPNFLAQISTSSWKSKRDEITRAYLYEYDNFSQLKSAKYLGSNQTGTFNENGRYDVQNLSYDLNGNIFSMNQSGLVNSTVPSLPSSYDWIDKLTYTYQGNQLLSVADASIYNLSGYNHFIDRNAKGSDYFYDANQRLITDKNKGIQLITYNPIGLVSTIKWNNGDELEFIYDALGNKRQSFFSIQGKRIFNWQFEAGCYYINQQLKFITHDEGRMVKNNQSSLKENAGNFLFHYDYTDHQGNTRMTFMPMLDSTGNWLCTYEFEDEQIQEFDTSAIVWNDFAEVFLNKNAPIQTIEEAYNGKFSGKINAVMGTNLRLHVLKGDTILASVYGLAKNVAPDEPPASPNWIYKLFGIEQITQKPLQENNIQGSANIYINLIALLEGIHYLISPYFNKTEQKGSLVLRALDSNNQVVKAIAIPLLGQTDWEKLSGQLIIDSANIKQVQVYVSSSNENTIYFDDLSVIRKRMLAQIVQENHYYPFGLNIKGLEFEAPGIDTNTIHLFNGKALVLKDYLEYYDHGARFLDPQIARWHSMDLLAGQFIEQSAYVAMQNNPVNKIDINGMEAWDPPGHFGFVLGVRFGIGTEGLNFNGTTSVGYQLGVPNANMQLLASIGMYGGSQLGTNANNSFQFDLSAGFLLQGGKGNAAAHSIYTMNYNTPSPFLNTNEYGAHWGQMLTYNSAINNIQDGPGVQTQGLFGMRIGNNFSFSYNNDATTFPTFAGLFRNKLGVKETDAAWTGGLAMNIAGVEFGYQNFSGYRLMNYPGLGIGHQYPQTSYHQSLNRASNFIQYNGLRLDVFGPAWLQNFIHHHISKESTYEYSKTKLLNLSGSIR